MEFIEIRDGLSIRVDAIEGVERRDELTSTVYTNSNSYESTFPYRVLIELLGISGEAPIEEVKPESRLELEKLNILKETGTPAW